MFDKRQVIPIGSDHGGYRMKVFLEEVLSAEGYRLKNMGTDSEKSVDYPDFIHPVAQMVNEGTAKFGIILCGSGQGASMTANKYSNVRSALCWDVEQAKLSRQHNDANILALPGRFLEFEKAVNIVKVFLNTPFEGGRHTKRIQKISV